MKKGSLIHIVLDKFPDMNKELVGRFKVEDIDGSRGMYLIRQVDTWQQDIEPPFGEGTDERDSKES